MGNITVRNLPDEIHQALRLRAASHQRSTEAEVRAILANAVAPTKKIRLGTAMASLSRQTGLDSQEAKQLDTALAHAPAQPMKFK